MRDLLISTTIGTYLENYTNHGEQGQRILLTDLNSQYPLEGDSDTLAAISATIAYAHYRVIPEALLDNARKKLPKCMLELSESFDEYCLGM